MCIVLSARNCNAEDGNLVDKEAILCSLNIKAMMFDDATTKAVVRSGSGLPTAVSIQWKQFITHEHTIVVIRKSQTPLHGHRLRTPATHTTNGHKFATSQHLDMSRCWAVALRCGKFVLELL